MRYEINEPLIARLPAGEYIGRFRRREYFESLCRSCPNYGGRWGCPPFPADPLADPSALSEAEIWLVKIDISDDGEDSGVEALHDILKRERGRWESELLALEKEREGVAALFTGMCPHCGERECARREGLPCRHPELVRPSLESLGFDLGKTARELFGVELLWASEGKLPAYVVFMGGLFSAR